MKSQPVWTQRPFKTSTVKEGEEGKRQRLPQQTKQKAFNDKNNKETRRTLLLVPELGSASQELYMEPATEPEVPHACINRVFSLTWFSFFNLPVLSFEAYLGLADDFSTRLGCRGGECLYLGCCCIVVMQLAREVEWEGGGFWRGRDLAKFQPRR